MELEVLHIPSQATGLHRIKRPPLLFVHGVCHGAWCWQPHYLPWFARRGWDCYALSLRGHGNSEGREALDAFGLDDYVSDVLKVVDQIGVPPVLVAHSMGGGIAQLALAQHSERLAGSVLLASMPPGWLTLREKLRLVTNLRGHFAFARLFRQKSLKPVDVQRLPFFDRRINAQSAALYAPLLQIESAKVRDEIVKFSPPAGRPRRPLFVLGSKQDRIFGASAVVRTALHYDTEATLLDRGCHDLMLDREWHESAIAIENWLMATTF